MNLDPRILQASDLEQLYDLEMTKLKSASADQEDDFQTEMLSWSAPWRKEALEYYLPLGWSFGLFEGDKLRAFSLSQPQLFVHGLTQNLWIEHLSYSNADEAKFLLELLYKTCREKHFQSIRLKEKSWSQYMPDMAKPLDDITEIHSFKTAKL